ncbi:MULTISPECIES: hypothetical protein [Sphingomonadales]|jgi:hypothetical protein|uniref:hypothetical protein n=1 Tax=Sphingomonadales TaxID=204457 RepID=UPI0003B75680|nr:MULTISPECIES: hypothetical protein [Sphingomonadales]|tara:strand:- start:1633 stop:1980 length:348 start_codon:yes stop_codon:yes gene_type:complete
MTPTAPSEPASQVTLNPERPRPPTRAERANPILLLPAMHQLRALDPDVQACLRDLLLDLQCDARLRARASWDAHKPPMAAYWAAVGVYSGHIARVLRRNTQSGRRRQPDLFGKAE